MPCPHCGVPQVLKWEQLRWPKDEPDAAAFVCVHCEAPIAYRWQRWMLAEADRRAQDGEPGIGWVVTNPDAEPRHASFHIWAAYSPAPNASWPQLAREWLAAHRNIEERKTFINTVLGEPYRGEGDAPEWKRLYARRADYRIGTVPTGGAVLFAGVDVQKDRLEVEIVAYGRRMCSWSVDYRVFPGDTAQLEGPYSPYKQLDALLAESFATEGGGIARIRRLAIDAGYNTNTVYQWVQRQSVDRVIAVDGRDSYQMIIGQPKAVETTVRGKRRSRSVKLWPIGTSLTKTELYGWLKQELPTDESGDEVPWGFCHFPRYPESYFRGLTAEEIVPRLVKGFRRYQWEKVYERNEPLDCRVYARAAAALEGIDRWSDEAWMEAERALAAPVQAVGSVLSGRKPKMTRVDDPYL